MPHVNQIGETRFYEPDEVPSNARRLGDGEAATWKKIREARRAAFSDAWWDQYGPSSTRTVAARFVLFQCGCSDCQTRFAHPPRCGECAGCLDAGPCSDPPSREYTS